MVRFRSISIALVALLASQTATAQPRAAVTEARQSLAQFAKCLSVSKAERVNELVSLPVDSAQYRRLAQRLYETADDMCVGDGSLRYNAVLFAGALYDALYARDFGYGGPGVFPENVASRYAGRYRTPYSADARQAIAIEHFGECVARAEPAEARKLLLAGPGTTAEEAQFATLKPRFQACVVNGKTVEMSKAVIRGAVAEGLYRLSKNASGATLGMMK
ncbi:MAG: hypothetical protein V4530_06770 [Pseudomonadota bacterium]